jgi:hypothetical protein
MSKILVVILPSITGHKPYAGHQGPARSVHLNAWLMRPFMGGGDMIREVHKDEIIYNDAPMKWRQLKYCANDRVSGA